MSVDCFRLFIKKGLHMNRMEQLRNARPSTAAQRVGRKTWSLAPLLAALLGAGAANAQVSVSPTPQFDVLGFIQAATLDNGTMCPTVTNKLLWGGTVTVNGIKMIVPCNTILQMPASTFTWEQLFEQSVRTPIPAGAPGLNGNASIPAGQTGLAIADLAANFTTPGAGGILLPTPFPSFEIRAVGNILKDANGNDSYVIGLIVPISQQGLNAGAGKITCIDYTAGAMYVGGTNLAAGTTTCTAANGVKIVINDPIGRCGIAHSPDPRFSADTNNTTIHAGSGYPMCIRARRAASARPTPLCPTANRPLNGDARFNVDRFLANGAPLKFFDMKAPAGNLQGAPPDPTGFPDPRQRCPSWSATSSTGRARSPRTRPAARELERPVHLRAYHRRERRHLHGPGVPPAYVSIESLLIGTKGTPRPGHRPGSHHPHLRHRLHHRPVAARRPQRRRREPLHRRRDAPPARHRSTPRRSPSSGRWRFHVLGGLFMPPTREMLAVSHTGTTASSAPGGAGYANGLGSGQYQAPDFDFIFPENVRIGEPIVPNNFQDFPFLTFGSGPFGGFGDEPHRRPAHSLAGHPGSGEGKLLARGHRAHRQRRRRLRRRPRRAPKASSERWSRIRTPPRRPSPSPRPPARPWS